MLLDLGFLRWPALKSVHERRTRDLKERRAQAEVKRDEIGTRVLQCSSTRGTYSVCARPSLGSAFDKPGRPVITRRLWVQRDFAEIG